MQYIYRVLVCGCVHACMSRLELGREPQLALNLYSS